MEQTEKSSLVVVFFLDRCFWFIKVWGNISSIQAKLQGMSLTHLLVTVWTKKKNQKKNLPAVQMQLRTDIYIFLGSTI